MTNTGNREETQTEQYAGNTDLWRSVRHRTVILVATQIPLPSVCFHHEVTIAVPIYRSLHTPEPRNPQKGSKRTSRASRQKNIEKVPPNTDFAFFLNLFRVIWDFCATFLTLRAGRPGKSFLRLFGGFQGSGVWRLLHMGIAITTLRLEPSRRLIVVIDVSRECQWGP